MEEESKLTKFILSPNLSGVYVSKADLQAVAASCGYALQIQERKRMLKELFALVREVEDFKRIIDAFSSFVAYKLETYKNIAAEFPSSSGIVATFEAKIKDMLSELERSKEEATLIG